MDNKRAPSRDRWIALGAAAVVVGLAVAVVATVLDADRRGRQALERLQVSQVEQLARGLDARLEAAFQGASGLAQAPYSLQLRDAGDLALLDQLQSLNPESRTGFMLVDASGMITNGTLLPAELLGTKLSRPGFTEALTSGKPSLLPVAIGVTSAVPTVGYVLPFLAPDGSARGAFVLESDLGPKSAFSVEVAEMRRGETGHFSFIDDHGTVVASSDATIVGRPFEEAALLDRAAGFHRVDGKVAVVDSVPSAHWQVLFAQDTAEFDGGLGKRIDNAVVLVIVSGLLAAAVGFVALLRRLRRAREEQRRLEEINRTTEEFMSIVSHELRTPVAGVLGFLQTTADHWNIMSSDEQRQAVERALANARRLHLFSQEILDTARLDRGRLVGDLEVIDLRGELDASVATARTLSPERLIALWMPDEPVWVKADPNRLRQVFSNLEDNALSHSPGSSPVTVRMEIEGDVVAVHVADEGPGIPPQEMERIFERFVRGRGTTVAGTGLGLHIARQIVDGHGGTISVANGTGRGATFTVRLPLAQAAGATAAS
jgi:signal transduction histidine kinase